MISGNAINYTMRNRRLRSRVVELAESSSNVVFTDHAEERMLERGISTATVLDVLRTGEVEYVRNGKTGDPIVKAKKLVKSNRSVGAISAVIGSKGRLVVITVEWEDLK